MHSRACSLGYKLPWDAFILREGLEVEQFISFLRPLNEDHPARAGEARHKLQDKHVQGHEVSDTAGCVLHDDIIDVAKHR